MKLFVVTFLWCEGGPWCTNLVKAHTEEAVREHYGEKYSEVAVRPAAEWELHEYRAKGIPVFELE